MVAYGRRPKRNQRESAYVSRQRTWRTLPEPSSALHEALHEALYTEALHEALRIEALHEALRTKALHKALHEALRYLINQTPRKKLHHGMALRASAALIESCKLLS